MKIDSSEISMSSRNQLVKKDSRSESLKAWIGDERPDFEGQRSGISQLVPRQFDTLTVSEQARAAQRPECTAAGDTEFEASADVSVNKLIVEMMIEAVTGKKQKIEVVKVPKEGDVKDLRLKDPAAVNQGQEKAGWGIEYDYRETHYEHEEMTFKADGVIRTTDGKEINISVQLAMSREYYDEQNISIRAGDAKMKDPLVINLDGSAPQLTDSRFAFDIDADGNKDNISSLSPGSGFLAIDKNGDGVVNDGTELFGPRSGNGFVELAQYDKDGNKWIDENDSVYSKLRIWTRDASGKDSLSTLMGNNIGAIYLENVSTSFEIKSSTNQLQGEARSAGIYLTENGSAGTVQQIDLAV